jgi:hypothetical protein
MEKPWPSMSKTILVGDSLHGGSGRVFHWFFADHDVVPVEGEGPNALV